MRVLTAHVTIPVKTVRLQGELAVPKNPSGLVLFAHGSGSSRFSPRNRYVAQVLQDGGIATLLFDLLTEDEGQTRSTRFDINLLADRLSEATHWVLLQDFSWGLPVGFFGASTGAAAALIAAARLQDKISCVVSRGGRPDLAEPVLRDVTAPTLLIVGGLDHGVIELNEKAYALLGGQKDLVIVPGATHLFEEVGTLEQAARSARSWFDRFFHAPKPDARGEAVL